MTRSSLPSVDRLLRTEGIHPLLRECGRTAVTDAIRQVLADLRAQLGTDPGTIAPSDTSILERVRARLDAMMRPTLRPVFNLTGTVLHTNLGRAPLPPEVAELVVTAATRAGTLEFDLEAGARGDRDDHVEALLCRLTGAEAATVVNNNAAAVLLVLNTLALRKEVPTSRGELIEIGGSFRMPEIMARAGCRLREVGTTNRVHLRDYADAITARTGAILKVHTSNYAIVGFTSTVPESDLAALCRERGVPFVVDLGSGTLIDLRRYGLPHEPTPQDALRAGADLVTFSGDKLLGGPQAGVIAGRAALVAQLKSNPLKRALRVDKMTLAALSGVLSLYADPDRLAERLPVLRMLTRPVAEIGRSAAAMLPAVSGTLGNEWSVRVTECASEIGSGALPTHLLPSAGLAICPQQQRRTGTRLKNLAAAFRALPIPVIGRIEDDAFVLDFRCLDDEEPFRQQLQHLTVRRQEPTIDSASTRPMRKFVNP